MRLVGYALASAAAAMRANKFLADDYARPDDAYVGQDITCANATYCMTQQALLDEAFTESGNSPIYNVEGSTY